MTTIHALPTDPSSKAYGMIRLKFNFDRELIEDLKNVLRRARSKTSTPVGGWMPEEKIWWVYPLVWHRVAGQLRALGYQLIDDLPRENSPDGCPELTGLVQALQDNPDDDVSRAILGDLLIDLDPKLKWDMLPRWVRTEWIVARRRLANNELIFPRPTSNIGIANEIIHWVRLQQLWVDMKEADCGCLFLPWWMCLAIRVDLDPHTTLHIFQKLGKVLGVAVVVVPTGKH